MNQYKALKEHFQGRKPVLNIVLDGYGRGKQDHTDAIFQARTPFMDQLLARYAHCYLATHGPHVGLPGATDLGGSEVGHLTLGAGKIIDQGPTLITKAIADGSFFKLPVLVEALKQAQGSALHLMGLLSDGNVHSHIDHFKAVVQAAARQGVKRCYLHGLMDGRDVGIQTADLYVEQMEELFAQIKAEHPGYDYAFASLGGREVITMDRDQNWAKVEAGWNCHVRGASGQLFDTALAGIAHFRQAIPSLIDQDCPPFNIKGQDGQPIQIQDGQVVIFMNFRADRAAEMARAFTEENFTGFANQDRPQVYFAGMMIYDEDTDLPKNRIIGGAVVERPYGKRILEMGLSQFRLTETQKYAHVTFFYNGGYRNPLDASKETYWLINSDRVPSFAQAPAMKAKEIADQAEVFLASGQHDFGLINFANADMVGHTGDFKAAVQAVEAVDSALARVCQAVQKAGGVALITADHGNADEMIIFNKKTKQEEVSTKHSINLVPCVLFDPNYQGGYRFRQSSGENLLNLSMIAATNSILLGQKVEDDLNDPLFAV